MRWPHHPTRAAISLARPCCPDNGPDRAQTRPPLETSMAESKRRTFLAGLAATAFTPAWAQAPNRHLTVVVGLAAGGGTDAVARLLQRPLQEALGQTVIVENKPGASGLIAADYVARAPADANVLMLAPSGVIVSSFVIKRKMPFALQDLAPVGL